MSYHHRDLRRKLIDVSLDLVTEAQAWDFSLRDVARRAGVSHNAPYNHFAEKRDLLAEVAAAGFLLLEQKLSLATANQGDAGKALLLLANAYLDFSKDNPALYRLMFGPMLADGLRSRPQVTVEAGAIAKKVLVGVLVRGAAGGGFSFDPDDAEALETAHLAVWATLHGLASLVLDRKAETSLPEDALAERIVRLLSAGLTNPTKLRDQDHG